MRGPPEPPDRSASVWWMSRRPPSGQPVASAAPALGSQPPGHVPGGAAGSRAGAGAGCCAPACCQEVSPRCPVFVNGASAPRRDGGGAGRSLGAAHVVTPPRPVQPQPHGRGVLGLAVVVPGKQRLGHSLRPVVSLALAPLGSYWSLLTRARQSPGVPPPGTASAPRGTEASSTCFPV